MFVVQLKADRFDLCAGLARDEDERNVAGPQFRQGFARRLESVGLAVEEGAVQVREDDHRASCLGWMVRHGRAFHHSFPATIL